jgi:SSS family solute:Na+ symporter
MGEKGKMLSISLLILFFIVFFLGYRYCSGPVLGHLYRAAHGHFLGRAGRRLPRPFLYGLYWKRTTKQVCGPAYITGVGIMCAQMICNFHGRGFHQANSCLRR